MNVQIPPAAPGRERPALWLQEVAAGLPVRAQFVLSGNIRDVYPVQAAGGLAFRPAAEALWSLLSAQGYAGLIRHDPVSGAVLHHECDPALLPRLAEAGVELEGGPRDLPALAAQIGRVAGLAELPVAFLIDYASQLCGRGQALGRPSATSSSPATDWRAGRRRWRPRGGRGSCAGTRSSGGPTAPPTCRTGSSSATRRSARSR